MKFLNLKVKNFLSYEQAEAPLSGQGLCLVVGENNDSSAAGSNGSGKSALLVDAWCWILWGRTPRGVSGSDIVRRGSRGGCFGELTLLKEDTVYYICRYQDEPIHKNSLYLSAKYIDAEEHARLTKPDKRETQKEIDRLIGIPMQVALCSMTLGQNSIAFATMTDSEKKKTFEEVLGFDVLITAQAQAKNEVKRLEGNLSGKQALADSYNQQLLELQTKVGHLERRASEWEIKQQQHKGKLEVKLQEVRGHIEDSRGFRLVATEEADKLNLQLKQVQRTIAEKGLDIQRTADQLKADTEKLLLAGDPTGLKLAVEEQKEAITGAIARGGETIRQRQVDLDHLKNTPVEEFCPTCGQDLPTDAVIKVRMEIEGRVSKAQQLLQEAESQSSYGVKNLYRGLFTATQALFKCQQLEREFQESHHSTLVELEEKQQRVHELDTDLIAIDHDLLVAKENAQICTNDLIRLEGEVSALSNELNSKLENPHSSAVKSTKETIKDINDKVVIIAAELSGFSDELKLYEFWVHGFGKSGIQSYMLDSIVPHLNGRVAEYSATMTASEVLIEFRTQRELADGRLKEDFHIVARNRFGADVYSGNSGGEQERIDICIALALQDLVIARQGREFSLCILDEVAKHLDADGQELYYQLLEQLARKRDSVFVITHSPHLETLFQKVWTARKVKGISELVCA